MDWTEDPARTRPGADPVGRGGALRMLLPAAALGVVAAACGLEAERPVLGYSLSTAAGGAAAVDEDGDPLVPSKVQAHVRGALEMLFGTPDAPQFMVTEDWYDDGYNPNFPQWPADDGGSGELSDEDLEAIQAENERLFAAQLALAREGRYEDVRFPAHMLDLAADYAQLLEDFRAEEARVEGGQGDAEELELMAEDLREGYFLRWYPTLRESAELYRVQCLHCHGVEGGGDGPTAPFLNPRPRDYRHGVFKFTAMNNKARPRRADLLRILEQGVTGTAMPSFKRFSQAELQGLVDYVRLLSVRGQVERSLVVTYQSDYDYDRLLPLSEVVGAYQDVWEGWTDLDDDYLAFDGEIPEVTPELLARGRELYADAARGNCLSCHGEAGLGDGTAAYELDADGRIRHDENGQPISAYEDDWGDTIFPRNLRRGIYRGGGRPIDVYRRIYAGINGTPMPGIGESKDAQGQPLLSSEDMWALVHYVRRLGENPRPARHAPEHGDAHAAAAPGHSPAAH